MLLDPESYIPVEVVRRTEIARAAYRRAPRLPSTASRRARLLVVLRRLRPEASVSPGGP